MAFGPYIPLIQLEAIQKQAGGMHPKVCRTPPCRVAPERAGRPCSAKRHPHLMRMARARVAWRWQTLFRAGGCEAYVGRKLDGKVCPPEDPPKRKKKSKNKPKKE